PATEPAPSAGLDKGPTSHESQERPQEEPATVPGPERVRSPAAADRLLRDKFPLQKKPNGSQPSGVLKFIRGGNYLDRPGEFAAHYLSGLFLNLFVLGSGLVFLAAFLAWFWRVFDMPGVRDLSLWEAPNDVCYDIWQNLTADIMRPFIPVGL